MNTSTSHSFVYPVKSLLTGNILPVAQEEPPPTDRQSSRRRRKRKARGLGAERVSSPNFRDYPGDDVDPSFATAPVPGPSKIVLDPPSTSPTATGDYENLTGSDPDSPSFYTTAGTRPPESRPRHMSDFDEVISDVFYSSAANLELYPRSRRRQLLGTAINMTDTSIVHLPPPRSASCLALSRDTPTPSRGSQHASDLQSTGYSSSSSSQHAQSTPQSLYGSLPSHKDDMHDSGSSFTVDLGQISAPLFPSPSSVSSGSDARKTGRSGRSTGGYSSSDEPLVTFRFEHREDGDGHHVVVGREGKLSRCEDEVSTILYILPRLSFQTLLTLSGRLLLAHKDSRFCAGLWCSYCRAGGPRWRQTCCAPSL
jgi:hypothetical protein